MRDLLPTSSEKWGYSPGIHQGGIYILKEVIREKNYCAEPKRKRALKGVGTLSK